MQKAILHAQLSVKDVRQSIQSKVESDMKCTSQVSTICCLETNSIIVDIILCYGCKNVYLWAYLPINYLIVTWLS